MIGQWLVAGPETMEQSHLNMNSELPPSLTALLAPDTPLPHLPGGWREIALDAAWGQLEFDQALGLEGEDTWHKFGYAVTEIESPDERVVTFALGSDAWSYMWLNGDMVHWNYDYRPALVDSDMFEARLKPGRNRFVVKLGNDGGPWEFSLSAIQGGEGLMVSLPRVGADEGTSPLPPSKGESLPRVREDSAVNLLRPLLRPLSLPRLRESRRKVLDMEHRGGYTLLRP